MQLLISFIFLLLLDVQMVEGLCLSSACVTLTLIAYTWIAVEDTKQRIICTAEYCTHSKFPATIQQVIYLKHKCAKRCYVSLESPARLEPQRKRIIASCLDTNHASKESPGKKSVSYSNDSNPAPNEKSPVTIEKQNQHSCRSNSEFIYSYKHWNNDFGGEVIQSLLKPDPCEVINDGSRFDRKHLAWQTVFNYPDVSDKTWNLLKYQPVSLKIWYTDVALVYSHSVPSTILNLSRTTWSRNCQKNCGLQDKGLSITYKQYGAVSSSNETTETEYGFSCEYSNHSVVIWKL